LYGSETTLVEFASRRERLKVFSAYRLSPAGMITPKSPSLKMGWFGAGGPAVKKS
jgi:hypothetical protein